MASTVPNASFEVLTHEECVDYLGREEVGRIAWITDGRPTLVPINYAWDGEAVVIRSDPGMKLNELRDTEVAFEIDRLDRDRRQGWSVVVHGVAREVSPDDWPATAIRPEALYLNSWAPGAKLHWIRLIPSVITGRSIRRISEAEANPFWFLSSYSFPVHLATPR